MSKAEQPSNRIDILLVASSIIILIAALWIWISALPIAREVVAIATTIALIIALVLTVNVSILVILRLQHRVSKLEDELATQSVTDESTLEPSVIVVTLNNTERRIINRLEENDGQMDQDELRKATGISKSTLSVTLQTLEGKALIERTSTGRTKTIRLIKKVNR
ncbi:MAG: MarR family transcriptional regulator [Candidatus Thorarchaeota archaeon]|nr:MarR family transcriptional regulator [Candidatus Thorarchaeota archaeon]